MSEDVYQEAQPQTSEKGRESVVAAESPSVSADRLVEQLVAQERQRRTKQLRIAPRLEALILLLVFAAGLGSGYVLRGRVPAAQTQRAAAAAEALAKQVNPPEGFKLPATYGDIGPQLLRTGAIDDAKFVEVYQKSRSPLSDEQLGILRQNTQAPIVINQKNAYFMLNFFWALGLVNKNPLLEQGQMTANGRENVGNFASTGGWTIGAKAATELYSSAEIVKLTPEQQARLEEVANNAYRPCCGNPTSFPDCNHGMALLGLLELMASQGATVDQMFTAAKQVNAFWFPDQTLELATYFKAIEGKDFKAVDARRIVGKDFMSASGFQATHSALASKGLLPQAPSSGQSCGV